MTADLYKKKQKNQITNQVQMVQSRGSRGLQLAGAMMTAMSFPASQIFTSCDYFPAEFSLVATIKTQRLREKVNQWNSNEPFPVISSLVCVFWSCTVPSDIG